MMVRISAGQTSAVIRDPFLWNRKIMNDVNRFIVLVQRFITLTSIANVMYILKNVETLNTNMQLRGEMFGGTEFLSILTKI